MTKYIDEPWEAWDTVGRDTCGLETREGVCIAVFDLLANRDRVQACVHALAGMNPDAVGDVVAAATLVCDLSPPSNPATDKLRAALAKLKETK